MHIKFRLTKKELWYFFWKSGTWQGIFERFAVCLFGRESDTFAIVSILCWSWGAESLAASAGRGGRGGQVGDPVPRDPGEAEPKVYVVLGWAGRPVSSAN